MLARFRETIPTVKSILSSKIQRINFGLFNRNYSFVTLITILPFFQKLEFLGSYIQLLFSLLLYLSVLKVASFIVLLPVAHLDTS